MTAAARRNCWYCFSGCIIPIPRGNFTYCIYAANDNATTFRHQRNRPSFTQTDPCAHACPLLAAPTPCLCLGGMHCSGFSHPHCSGACHRRRTQSFSASSNGFHWRVSHFESPRRQRPISAVKNLLQPIERHLFATVTWPCPAHRPFASRPHGPRCASRRKTPQGTGHHRIASLDLHKAAPVHRQSSSATSEVTSSSERPSSKSSWPSFPHFRRVCRCLRAARRCPPGGLRSRLLRSADCA